MTTTEMPSLEQLWAENAILQAKLLEKNQHIHHLEEQLVWFKRQIFGKRSERVVSNLNQQQLVFEGFATPEAPKEKEQEIPAIKDVNQIAMGKIRLHCPPIFPSKRQFWIFLKNKRCVLKRVKPLSKSE